MPISTRWWLHGITCIPSTGKVVMANPKWKRSDFYQLDTVEYRPESGRVRVRFRNNEIGEATTEELWRNRPGQPDWSKVTVDPHTHGAILVPTLPGHPTIEGEIAEIPGDMLRAVTDVDYRAHIANRVARWAKRIGQELAGLREQRGLTQQAVA